MTLLPIVVRELIVASRESNTYRVRFLSAFLTVVFSAFSLWFVTLFGDRQIHPRELFVALAWIAFVFVSISGFCLTADCISEEKRENTLGFLFLTDLKGFDVVMGKLAGASLRGFYALLAIFPVLALPLIMGGVGPLELVRILSVLSLTMVLSMAVGVATSTVMTKTWGSVGLSGFTVIFLLLGLPILSVVVNDLFHLKELAATIRVLSPSYTLVMGFSNSWGMTTNSFYFSIFWQMFLAATLLVFSIWLAPRIWQHRAPKRKGARFREFLSEARFGAAPTRRRLRQRLLARNPIYWLSARQQVSSPGLFLIFAAGALGMYSCFNSKWLWMGRTGAEQIMPFVGWVVFASVVHILLILRISVSAAERFGEDRKSGALELVLSTPLSVRRVIHGQWLALGRAFAGPALAALVVHACAIAWLVGLQPMLSWVEPGRGIRLLLFQIVDHILGDGIIPRDWENHFSFLVMAGLAPLLALNWVAVASLSMWLSLKVKKAIVAPFGAIVLVMLPPWFMLGLLATICEWKRWDFDRDFSQAFFYYASAAMFILVAQIFWIRLSHREMLKQFRIAATDRYQPPARSRWWQMRVA